MLKKRHHFLLLLAILPFFCSNGHSMPPAFLNRIEGQVFDPSRRPVPDVQIELYNEVNSYISNTKTTSSGRFTFSGMVAGRYTIQVKPFGTNFKEQSQEVFVTNLTRVANDVEYVDIYLDVNKRQSSSNDGAPEVVFVQDVPSEAKKLYAEGADDLKGNRAGGAEKLEKALVIFPNYFDSLSLLGKYYILQKNYQKGYPYLIRAIDENSRCFSCYYRLGYAFYQLKQYRAALEAAKASTILSPESLDAQILFGTLLRIDGNYIDAEKTLQKANKLADGKNSDVHMQLALLFNRLNRNKEAIVELETYLKLDPNSPDKLKIQDLIAKLQASQNKSE